MKRWETSASICSRRWPAESPARPCTSTPATTSWAWSWGSRRAAGSLAEGSRRARQLLVGSFDLFRLAVEGHRRPHLGRLARLTRLARRTVIAAGGEGSGRLGRDGLEVGRPLLPGIERRQIERGEGRFEARAEGEEAGAGAEELGFGLRALVEAEGDPAAQPAQMALDPDVGLAAVERPGADQGAAGFHEPSGGGQALRQGVLGEEEQARLDLTVDAMQRLLEERQGQQRLSLVAVRGRQAHQGAAHLLVLAVFDVDLDRLAQQLARRGGLPLAEAQAGFVLEEDRPFERVAGAGQELPARGGEAGVAAGEVGAHP